MKIDLAAKTLLAALARAHPLVVEAAWQIVLGRQRVGLASPVYVAEMQRKLLGLGLVETEAAASLDLGAPVTPALSHQGFVAVACCKLCGQRIEWLPPVTELVARMILGRMRGTMILHADHSSDTECLGVLDPLGVTRS